MISPRKGSGILSFNPPHDAEPSNEEAATSNGEQNPISNNANGESDIPTVLTKLQKWADYPSIGKPVRPTNFLPMKTPMSLEIISNWSLPEPPKHRLTVPELLSGQEAAGRCVGMVIDLANHECLYADDLPESLEYTHIQLVAKVLPPPEAINEVAAAAGEFWSRRPNDFIAIHCAYGFNRTGFVVCSYLCQVCGMTVPEALESFAAARPPGVKHGKFVDELYARYGGKGENNISTKEKESNTLDSNTAAGGNSSLLSMQLRQASQSGSIGGGGDGSASFSRRSSGADIYRDDRDTAKDTASDEGYPASIPSKGSPSAASSTSMAVLGASSVGTRSVRSMLTNTSSRSLNAVTEGEVDAAGVEGEGGALPAGNVVELGASAPAGLQGGENWSAMAQTLDNKSLMRRETSLGLAKALHEDFGVHENTPNRQGPSPLMALLNSEEGEEEEGEGGAALAAIIAAGGEEEHDCDDNRAAVAASKSPPPASAPSSSSAADHPAATATSEKTPPPKSPLKSPRSPSAASGLPPVPPRPASTNSNPSPPPSVASFHHQWNVPSLASRSVLLDDDHTGDVDGPARGLPRNMSVDSDCHSLGFNSRQAILNLRNNMKNTSGAGAAGSANGNLENNRQESIASDIDLALWEVSGSAGDGIMRLSPRQPTGGKKDSGRKSGCRMM